MSGSLHWYLHEWKAWVKVSAEPNAENLLESINNQGLSGIHSFSPEFPKHLIWLPRNHLLRSSTVLTSHQETDSSNRLDMRNKQYHMNSNSWFNLHSLWVLYCYFQKQHGHLFLFTKEACSYVDADWLSSSVSQKVVTGQLHWNKSHFISTYIFIMYFWRFYRSSKYQKRACGLTAIGWAGLHHGCLLFLAKMNLNFSRGEICSPSNNNWLVIF